ncbi:MAG: PAS domain S-box protein, partial [bacterium]|nr:PAS domain S-box protein [bacterium]
RTFELFGFAADDLSKRLPMLDLVAPEDRDRAQTNIARRSQGENSGTVEYQAVKNDGSVFPALFHASAIMQDDVLCGFRSIVIDITERKRMEQALRESEEHYRTLFESLPIPVFTKNREGKYTSCNTENQKYWSVSPIGRTDVDALDPATAAALRESDLYVMESGDTLTIEEHFVHTPLGDRHVLSRKVPLRDGSGSIVGILGASLDITAHKQAEAALHILNEELELRVSQRTVELEAINKELQEFAYIVSHDLKAPLRGINQLAHWLHEDYADLLGGQGQEQLDLLVGRVKRMDSLINGVLRYSRATRGSECEESVDLNMLVPQVIGMLVPPTHIAIRIEDELPAIPGDPIQLTQVFQNLLSNAVKFMDKAAGTITVTCEDGGEVWTFGVEDNGPGIEARHHERIFQLFRSCTSMDERESTGIGLTVVKKIVESRGGRIRVESMPGQGSRFSFTWPK